MRVGSGLDQSPTMVILVCLGTVAVRPEISRKVGMPRGNQSP
jgi:hypothetical protein